MSENEDAKCVGCGCPFTKVNAMGLCPDCQNEQDYMAQEQEWSENGRYMY